MMKQHGTCYQEIHIIPPKIRATILHKLKFYVTKKTCFQGQEGFSHPHMFVLPYSTSDLILLVWRNLTKQLTPSSWFWGICMGLLLALAEHFEGH